MLGDLSESLHGVRTVAAYNRQRQNVVQHRNVVGDYRDANNYTAQINAIYGPGTQLLGYLGAGGAAGDRRPHGARTTSSSIGALVAFFLYLNRFFAPIQLLVQQYNTFQQGQASVLKLRTLFAIEPSTPEAPDAVELPPIEGEIVLRPRHVRLRPGDARCCATSTCGSRAGRDGRVRRPDRRRQVDDRQADHPLLRPDRGPRADRRPRPPRRHDRLAAPPARRRPAGAVPVRRHACATTSPSRCPDATDDEVWEAVDAVGLREVVERMPDGLDTVVHERGQSLSSGERQLIALARAFLAQPRVLVLDEATSNLDLLSETKIEAALDVLLAGAHRGPDRAPADDRDEGRPDRRRRRRPRSLETGSHDELVARGGRYAEMYATWTQPHGARGVN